MKTKIGLTCFILLFIQNLYSQDTTTIENTQSKPNQFIEDVKNDGLNSTFFLVVTDVNINNLTPNDEMDVGGVGESAAIATIRVSLLPNTWNISFSYSRQFKDKSLILGDGDAQTTQDNISQNGYIFDDGEIEFEWIDFYMKPISTKYGNIGFGYKYNVSTTLVTGKNYYVLDKQNNNSSSTSLYVNGPGNIRSNGEYSQYYITYDIPTTDSWYNGFGFQYKYATSNTLIQIIEQDGLVLKPSTTSNLVSTGWSKTLEEVNNGLSFKKFEFGAIASTHKYYNYETVQDESLNTIGMFGDIEIIYMFKQIKDKIFYISAGMYTDNMKSGARGEAKFELGIGF